MSMPYYDLPFAVLRVSLRALEQVRLPAFPGSKLEGAFGRTLYALGCTQQHRESCTGCSLQHICPYGLAYAPRVPEALMVSSLATPPRPVIFRVSYDRERVLAPDELLCFGFVVVGHALQQLPYLLAALREVGQQGMGHTRGRLELEEVTSIHPYSQESRVLMQGDKLDVNLSPLMLNAKDFPESITTPTRIRLAMRSPINIQVRKRMAERLQFPVLIRALQRRISNLEQVHGGQQSLGKNFSELPKLAQRIENTVHDLQFVSQARKGPTKHQKTHMQGLVGELEFQGDLEPFMPLLRFGEQLGVGKWAHFGGGLYNIEELA